MRAIVGCLGIGFLVATSCGGGSSSSSSTGTSTSTGSSRSNNGPTNSNGRNSLTGQCTGSTSSQMCTGVDGYVQCFEAACDSQLKAALGAGYASGSPSGPCGPYLACELACPCDATATACESNCYATDVTDNASCSSAFSALSSCALSSGCKTPVCAANATGTVTNTATSVNTATLSNTGTTINSATSTSTATLSNTRTLTNTASNTNTATTNCAALLGCCDTLLAGDQAAAYQQTCTQLATYGDAVCLQVLSEWEQAGICSSGNPTNTGTTTTATRSNTGTPIGTGTVTNTTTLPGTATLTNTNTATTNCAALASCCDVLLASQQAVAYQQSCAELTTATDAVCLEILSSWQQAGICK